MGFKPQGVIYNLNFVDGPYEGLIIKIKGMSIGRLTSFTNEGWNSKDPAKNIRVFEYIASRIVEWNLEHPEVDNPSEDDASKCALCGLSEGNPMPKVGQSFLCIDLNLIMKIMNTWVATVAEVNPGKEQSMPNGEMLEKALAMLQSEMLPTPNLST
jgi:hypothetical protein